VSSLYGDIVAVTQDHWDESRNSGGGGITATGDWAEGGFELIWLITEDNGLFTYSYWINGGDGAEDPLHKDLSHWILELTPPAEIWEGEFDSLVDTVITEIDVRLFEAYEPPNPDLPGDLFGVKFDFNIEDGTYHLEFTTEQLPVWGNFFATGGQDYAYNDGFPSMPDGMTTDFKNWIARPDGATLPEPSTLVLLLSGMGVLAGAARFRKKT